MKSVEARLSWSLSVTCPHCDQDTDLSTIDDNSVYCVLIFNNKWDGLKGQEVECPVCGKVFQIDDISV